MVYLVASLLMYLTVALVGMSILILAGKLIFGLRFAGSWLNVLGAFILSALAFYTFGFLISELAASARAAQTIGMVIFFPMMFLSGAGLPIQMLPEWLRRVSDFLPLTYVVRLIQGLWFNDSWNTLWVPVTVLVGILIIGTLLAARFFRWE
jgi:ABC-2 type transport system permease protein